jgi:hypothetical protein
LVLRAAAMQQPRYCARQQAADVTSKVDKIRAAWIAGDRIGALRIAARFFDRSSATKCSSAAWLRTIILAFTDSLGMLLSKL